MEKEFKLHCLHCDTDIDVLDDDISAELDDLGQIDLTIDCNNCGDVLAYHFISPSELCLDGQ